MQKTKLLVIWLCLWLGWMPLAAQSVSIVKDMHQVPMASVLAMYKNEFGSYEKPDMTDTFPYAVIRMHLEGSNRAVREAKERLTLYMGQQMGVERRVTTYSNQMLFLVRARHPMIYIDCGDGCERVLLSNMQQLKSNCVYDCTITYEPQEEVIAPQVLTQYPYTLKVSPADAKVEAVANGVRQEWVLIDGIAKLFLTEGSYHYTITAKDYQSAVGELTVSASHTDTTITLIPNYGWLSVDSDNTDLSGVSVAIMHDQQTNQYVLPIDKMRCNAGSYTLTISKPKYQTWTQEVLVSANQYTVISPMLQAKAYRCNTYLLATGGMAMNPAWSAGLMVGQTYGEVKSKVGIGWMMKGRSNFQFTENTSGLVCEAGGKVNGELMYYTGNKTCTTWHVNAGLLLNFLHGSQHPNNTMGMHVSVGYGQYHSLWEMTNQQWVEYGPTAAKGLSCGAGLMGSIKGFTLMAGVNTIGFKYLEIEAGLGWTF